MQKEYLEVKMIYAQVDILIQQRMMFTKIIKELENKITDIDNKVQEKMNEASELSNELYNKQTDVLIENNQ